MSDNDLLLNPPSFDFPSDYYTNPSDYELWSLRVPIHFDVVTHLDNQSLHIQNLVDKKSSNDNNNNIRNTNNKSGIDESILTSFQVGENDDGNLRTYTLSLCPPSETQSFRILHKKYKDDDDNNNDTNDDDDEDDEDHDDIKKKEMIPMPVTFTRNLSIVETTRANITEIELAPSIDRAPTVNLVKEKMRIPYVKIDQKVGLKKRWNVFGSNGCVSGTPLVNVVENVHDTSTVNASSKGGHSSIISKPTSTATAADSKKSKKRKVSDDVMESTDTSPSKKKKKSKKEKKSKKSKSQ